MVRVQRCPLLVYMCFLHFRSRFRFRFRSRFRFRFRSRFRFRFRSRFRSRSQFRFRSRSHSKLFLEFSDLVPEPVKVLESPQEPLQASPKVQETHL